LRPKGHGKAGFGIEGRVRRYPRRLLDFVQIVMGDGSEGATSSRLRGLAIYCSAAYLKCAALSLHALFGRFLPRLGPSFEAVLFSSGLWHRAAARKAAMII
jgi:hypothetical protein